MTLEDTRIYRDGGYGWVVVLAMFLINGIGDGIGYTYGILLIELVDTFQSNRGQTALVGGLFVCFTFGGGVAAGPLSDIYGYRAVSATGAIICSTGLFASAFVTELYQLYITFGFLGGIGFGLAVTPTFVCVIHNFRNRRSLAFGIALSGSGAGMFGMSALIGYLLDLYGWRGTFIMMAGVNLQSVVCAFLLNSPGHKEKLYHTFQSITISSIGLEHQIEMSHIAISNDQTETTEEVYTNPSNSIDDVSKNDAIMKGEIESTSVRLLVDLKGLFQNIQFVTFLLSIFIASFGTLAPLHLLPDQAVSLGILENKVFWIVAVLGIGNTVGRITIGWLGDIKCVNRYVLFVTILVSAGIVTSLSCLDITFEFKMGYACIYGFIFGGFFSMSATVLADIIGVDQIGKGMGLFMGSCALGYMLGGPLGGWIFDMTGNYNYSFIVAGSFNFIGAVIFSAPRIWKTFAH